MLLRGRWIWAVLALLGVALGIHWGTRFWKAEQLLVRLAGKTQASLASRSPRLVTEELSIASGFGPIRARLYRQADAVDAPAIVLAHGVHYQSIDEKRLVTFATALAEAGNVILTPELRDLADYRITDRSTREIADSVHYLASQSHAHVGLMGFSFAGGLSLLSATDPTVNRELSWVASVGGHHDLARVLKYFAEDRIETPNGPLEKQAHEYGIIVLLYDNLARFVPESDREVMSQALQAWLHEDRTRARTLSVRRSSLEAERLFSLIETRRLKELRPELEAVIAARSRELELLSPRGKLSRISCPVYLLHGAGDSVIPASETEWADLELGRRSHTALVSPLLEHVEVSHEAGLVPQLELLSFIANLM